MLVEKTNYIFLDEVQNIPLFEKLVDGQIHHATVEKYLGYLTASFVFYQVNRFDLKGRKQLATLEKYYLADMGLLNILKGKERTTDRGQILENVVYLELLYRGNKKRRVSHFSDEAF